MQETLTKDKPLTNLSAELIAIIEENGYSHAKLIGNKLCAVAKYNFTYGLLIDINIWSHGRRYCYEHMDDALVALENMTDTTDHASGPWIKCKGIYNGTRIDLLNPDLQA